MDYQKEINTLEMNINRMMELVGTKYEVTSLEEELKEEWQKVKKDNEEPPKVYAQPFSSIINYLRQQKAELLKNKDLASYFELIKNNKEMINNFSNYANTSLNIKDKVRILMHIKEEILTLSQQIVKLETFQTELEELKKQTEEIESKFNEEKMLRLNKLIERSSKQNEEVLQIIEIYKEMVTYINNKVITGKN